MMLRLALVALVIQSGGTSVERSGDATSKIAVAARAARPLVIDGLAEDDVWQNAARITAFREFQPREDADPRFPTEAMVAFDARNFYVFVRMFDPRPDSILKLLSRRDVRSASDQIKIMIDSYHDRRTGFEFAVNPAGVKRDYAIYDDGREDEAWDGIWEVATQVDSLGWTAEFKIPLSQLRYAPGVTNTFGFGIWRDIQRYTERVSWPLWRPSQAGLVSQLGEVTGLVGLAPPRRLELMPYAVTKNVSVPDAGGYGRGQRLTGGLDLKYRVTSNLTLDAAVNPDFGQVEADPGVLNLSAFESFFQERRPFFLEGVGVFQFPVNCSAVNDCGSEALFYSRRIGRAPQLAGLYGDATTATGTTILGAGKLTGRLPNGLTLGLFEAVTGQETGTEDRTMEPTTNYTAIRAQQDFRRGESGVGVVLTGVNRSLDQWTEDILRREAYVAAADFRHRFAQGRFQLSGALGVSRVLGSADAIAATQRSSVHFYQRPDDALQFDPTRTSLTGHMEEIKFGKFGGGITRFETSYLRRSPGFEANDMGFLLRADERSWNNWFQFRWQQPTKLYRMAFWNLNYWHLWTAAGLPTERAANSNIHAQLNNQWWVHGGATLGRLGGTYCDRCARGGPALRSSMALWSWGGVEGDGRPAVVPSFWFNYSLTDGGRSEFVSLSPSVRLRVSTPVQASIGAGWSKNRADAQWYGNFTDQGGTTHYTFAYLDQTTTSLTTRVDYTFTPTLTLQLYAQPFVSKGTYRNVRELADPRAAKYEDRFQPYGDQAVTDNPGGFNFKQFRSNLVLRWEYRPGSTLYVVWNQGRTGFLPLEGDRSITGDYRDLFSLRPDNTFLIKASYWINW